MLFLMGILGMVAVGAAVMVPEEDDEVDSVTGGGEGAPEEAEITDGQTMGDMLTAALKAAEEADTVDWGIQDGTEDDDETQGTENNEFLLGRGGDDLVMGNGGVDHMEGGAGADTMFGGAENDELDGHDENDLLIGGEGDDALRGHFGNDTLDGGIGDDSLIGGQGQDVLLGGEGDDELQGYHGDDTLVGGAGEDTLFANIGDDSLVGSSEDEDDGVLDYLNGGEGDDTIAAGALDVVSGGPGADVIGLNTEVTATGAVQVTDFEQGIDRLIVAHEGADAPEIEIEQENVLVPLYRVLADGELLAEVMSPGGFSADDIELIAPNAA